MGNNMQRDSTSTGQHEDAATNSTSPPHSAAQNSSNILIPNASSLLVADSSVSIMETNSGTNQVNITSTISYRERFDEIMETNDFDGLESFIQDTEIPKRTKVDILCSPDSRKTSWKTPLMKLISKQAPVSALNQMINIYAENNALSVTDKRNHNVLHYACNFKAPFDTIHELVRYGGKEFVNAIGESGLNCLMIACAYGQEYECIRLLVEYGGLEAVTATNQKDGSNPVMFACCNGQPFETIKLLLECGRGQESVMSTNVDGQNALIFSCGFGQSFETIKLLIEYGGREAVTHVNKHGRNALMYACHHGCSVEIVKLLVAVGGKETVLAKRNHSGHNSLMLACENEASSPEIITTLIDAGGIDILLDTTKDNHLPISRCLSYPEINRGVFEAITTKWLELDPELSSVPPTVITNSLLKAVQRQQSDSDSDFLLDCTFTRSLLNKFSITRRTISVLMLEFYVQIGAVIIVSFGISWNQAAAFSLLLICTIWIVFKELVQSMTTPLRIFVTDPFNGLDAVQIILLILLLIDMRKVSQTMEAQSNLSSSLNPIILTTSTGIVWLQLLIAFGKLSYSLSIFVSALFEILRSLTPFIFTSFMFVSTFIHMYWNAMLSDNSMACDSSSFLDRDNSWLCNLSETYFKVFAMFLTQDFTSSLLEDSTATSTILIVIAFLFAGIAGILILNILIAVIISIFERVLLQGEKEFWLNRLSFISKVECLFRILPNFFWRNEYNFKTTLLTADTNDKTLRKSSIGVKIRETPITTFDDGRLPFHIDAGSILFREVKAESDKEKFFSDQNEANFFSWWYFAGENSKDRPNLKERLYYFYKRASWAEIIAPSDEFEKILLGIKLDSQLEKNLKWILVHFLISVPMFFCNCILCVTVVLLGLVTFGLCWPMAIRKFLFRQTSNYSETNKSKGEREAEELKNVILQTEMNMKEAILKVEEEYERKMKEAMIKMERDSDRKMRQLITKMEQQTTDLKNIILKREEIPDT